MECVACSHYHFPPSVLPEIDGDDIGELILSSLYPFSQVQLFLRYRTGDLLRRHEICSLYDDYGYSFVGRIKDSVSGVANDGRQAWLSPLAVAEVLDAIDLGCNAVPADMQDLLVAGAPGRRIFALCATGDEVVVRVAKRQNDDRDLAFVEALIRARNFELTGCDIAAALRVELVDADFIRHPAIY